MQLDSCNGWLQSSQWSLLTQEFIVKVAIVVKASLIQSCCTAAVLVVDFVVVVVVVDFVVVVVVAVDCLSTKRSTCLRSFRWTSAAARTFAPSSTTTPPTTPTTTT